MVTRSFPTVGRVSLTRNNNVLFNRMHARAHTWKEISTAKIKTCSLSSDISAVSSNTIHNIPSLENTSSIPVFPRAPPLSLIIHS